ncbi:MAG TPA: hypothetical protein VMT27_05560, partial [Actinomycetes bacterium]|nr:hypothetical protein [Actinomycetes bacterium]
TEEVDMSRISTSAAVILTVIVITACGNSNRHQYSYEGVKDDAFAEKLYLQDQVIAVGAAPQTLADSEFRNFVAIQTRHICKALGSGATFDELVQFMSDNFKISNSRQFVGNAAGYSCPHLL